MPQTACAIATDSHQFGSCAHTTSPRRTPPTRSRCCSAATAEISCCGVTWYSASVTAGLPGSATAYRCSSSGVAWIIASAWGKGCGERQVGASGITPAPGCRVVALVLSSELADRVGVAAGQDRVPAVDRQHDAGHISRIVGSQPQDCPGD